MAETRQVKILGVFGPKSQLDGDYLTFRQTVFVGEFDIKEDGEISGLGEDQYGRFFFDGTITAPQLVFAKRYGPDSKGFKGVIMFEFNPRFLSVGGDQNVSGGWKGEYTLSGEGVEDVPEAERSGQAECCLIPIL